MVGVGNYCGRDADANNNNNKRDSMDYSTDSNNREEMILSAETFSEESSSSLRGGEEGQRQFGHGLKNRPQHQQPHDEVNNVNNNQP